MRFTLHPIKIGATTETHQIVFIVALVNIAAAGSWLAIMDKTE